VRNSILLIANYRLNLLNTIPRFIDCIPMNLESEKRIALIVKDRLGNDLILVDSRLRVQEIESRHFLNQ
jgi:hypothetical protein